VSLILNSAARIVSKFLDSPTFHLFSNLYMGSKLINASTTKFSQLPTKHSNLVTLPISTIFCKSNLTRALAPLHMPNGLLSTQNNRHTSTHHVPVLCNALQKEVCQPFVHSSQANQFDSAAPLLALSISQLHSKLKTDFFQQEFLPYFVSQFAVILLLSWLGPAIPRPVGVRVEAPTPQSSSLIPQFLRSKYLPLPSRVGTHPS